MEPDQGDSGVVGMYRAQVVGSMQRTDDCL